MEPLSTTAIIWSGITTIAGTLAGGVAGNRADAGFVLSYEKIRENLSQYRPDGNHDLERAIYRAYLQACLLTMIYRYGQMGYDTAGWVRWEVLPTWAADAVRRWHTHPNLGKTSEAERQWIETVLPRLRDALAFCDQSEFITTLRMQPELAVMRENTLCCCARPTAKRNCRTCALHWLTACWLT
jgi:hypothetical protein